MTLLGHLLRLPEFQKLLLNVLADITLQRQEVDYYPSTFCAGTSTAITPFWFLLTALVNPSTVHYM